MYMYLRHHHETWVVYLQATGSTTARLISSQSRHSSTPPNLIDTSNRLLMNEVFIPNSSKCRQLKKYNKESYD